jgi:hypothetical protein
LYGDVIIFAGCLEQLMMWCLKILAHEVDMKDVGVWQLLIMVHGYVPSIHRWSMLAEGFQDVVIVSCFVGYNETSKAYRIYIPAQKKIW